MLENGRGLIKALENWAKKVTTGYKDVNVRDLSTSFRDGLAFCAIIHHYRPDLIDFDSLSRDNIFENNSMAFSVAERQLGVPALLDAEDMVKYTHPDRLSIITYLSQLRNCFENQNKVNKKPSIKRIQKNSSGPPAKLPTVQPSLRRHDVCHVCNHRVFILERLMVDGKLYHTTCFRCHKCNNLLNPGAYVDSDTAGKYECSVCLADESSDNTESSMETSEDLKNCEVNNAVIQVPKLVVKPEKEFASKEAVSFAKTNLSENNAKFEKPSPLLRSLKSFDDHSEELKRDDKVASEIKISVKDKINVFEKNQGNEKPSSPASPSVVVVPVPKPRHSPVCINNTEAVHSSFSDKFSLKQSLVSAKSPEKCDIELEEDNLSSKTSFSKSLVPKKELSLEEIYSNEKTRKELNVETNKDKIVKKLNFEANEDKIVKKLNVEENKDKIVKELNVEANEVTNDNVTKSNTILNKVPIADSDASSTEIRNLNRENNIFSVRSGSESPKISRDIFKSSLQPLKLSLLSPSRKDSSSSPSLQSESPKTFDIPQIKSIYSAPGIGRMNHSPAIKESHSEYNLSSKVDEKTQDKVIRRSSLESSCKTDSKESQNKSSFGNNSVMFHRTYSSHELDRHADTDVTKTGLKSYTPLYKSLYSTSSITTSRLSKNNSDDSLQPSVVTLVKKESEKELNSSVNLSSEVNGCGKTSGTEVIKELEVPSIPNVYVEKVIESKDEEYPDDLNPFGDEESDRNEEYPDDLNPFGDEEVNTSKVSAEDYDESKNPFASDDDDEDIKDTSTYSPKPPILESKSPYLQDSICSTLSSPSGSLKGTLKKRPAPRPPKVTDIFPKESVDSGMDSSSAKVSPSISKKNFQTSSPKLRKNKPAPPPPPSPSPSLQDPAASVKMTKETDNMKLKSTVAEDKQIPKQYKKKKRPAPPVPIPVRRDMKKIPLKEIIQEMKEIEEKQREYERQGREIELLIRDRDKDEEPSVEEEEYIMQLFELVNQKNALFRRQAELMYIKRSQRLEEQQYQIEQEIRQLMEKPDSEKTEEDKQKEEELTLELIDIVDQRNSIIDSIEMDRRRELEEDHSVQEQLEIKNGDLPITAEIKQKSGKNKKKKDKKEKKKQQQAEEDSGKGTLRKKKLFSKRS